MAVKKNRTLKVYSTHAERKDKQCLHSYTGIYEIKVPMIILKGLWLNECGFRPGTKMNVQCENGKLIITAEEYVDE